MRTIFMPGPAITTSAALMAPTVSTSWPVRGGEAGHADNTHLYPFILPFALYTPIPVNYLFT
jgi:hypothetical protein